MEGPTFGEEIYTQAGEDYTGESQHEASESSLENAPLYDKEDIVLYNEENIKGQIPSYTSDHIPLDRNEMWKPSEFELKESLTELEECVTEEREMVTELEENVPEEEVVWCN